MAKKLKVSESYSPIFNRLIILCNSKEITISSLLDEFATSRSAINAWKKGNISAGTVASICERLNISMDFLVTGKTQPEVELSDDEKKLLNTYRELSEAGKIWLKMRTEALLELETLPQTCDEIAEEPETRFIEYSTLKVSAGTGQYLDTGLMEQMKIIKNELTADASFAVKITGDSMEPLYEDGEIVLVKSQPTVELGEVGIFIVGGLGYIKKLGEDRLISVNPYYNDILFHEEDEIYCKGLVIGVLEDEDILD